VCGLRRRASAGSSSWRLSHVAWFFWRVVTGLQACGDCHQAGFWQKSNCLVPHEDGRYGCPLVGVPDASCPCNHANWAKGGCVTTLPTSPGNRIRHELDRASDDFKRIYRQRTATERINSQALELGIERPYLRNGRSIANLNTLVYVLINLRTLHRIRSRLPQADPAGTPDLNN
jgi:hypothetical protein